LYKRKLHVTARVKGGGCCTDLISNVEELSNLASIVPGHRSREAFEEALSLLSDIRTVRRTSKSESDDVYNF
jgi:hypothetical protein